MEQPGYLRGATGKIHHHEPDGEAILLGITDRPVFEAFNIYAEAEPLT